MPANSYEWWSAPGAISGCCVLFWLVVPERYSALRYGAAVYAVVLIATKLVASPLGGNVSRLNQYAAGPLLACALWEYRRVRVWCCSQVPLLFWQWFPALDTMVFARSDPSTHRAYYTPLISYLDHQDPHLRSGRDTRHVPTLGSGLRRAPVLVGTRVGAAARLRLRRGLLRQHTHREPVRDLALAERCAVRGVARREAGSVVVRRGES